MNFAIVILTYNQAELTADCIKSIQAVKPRDFPDKQIFIVHNGSSNAIIQELRTRYPRFYHVVLVENEGFSVGANAGLRAAFQNSPWVLFLTQDTSLAHFPKAPPAEPCLSAVKVYKRKVDVVGSMGGAVDLEIAKHYFCPKAPIFWNAFESPILKPFVPRTAFWIHQTPFEKVNGFDESLGSIWEDVDLSLRLREEGEMLQLDETTEVIHHRKGLSRRDPWIMNFLYHRNRFAISRRESRKPAQRILFEVSLFFEWLFLLLGTVISNPGHALFVLRSYPESFRQPLRSSAEILNREPVVEQREAFKTTSREKNDVKESPPKKFSLKKTATEAGVKKKARKKNTPVAVNDSSKTKTSFHTETEKEAPGKETSEDSDE